MRFELPRAAVTRTRTYLGNFLVWYLSAWAGLYLGVQGYFPLTGESEPTIEQCVDGWRRHVGALEEKSRRYRKPVLFTEIGFKSTVDAAGSCRTCRRHMVR